METRTITVWCVCTYVSVSGLCVYLCMLHFKSISIELYIMLCYKYYLLILDPVLGTWEPSLNE